MATPIGNLTIDLGLEVARFNAGLAKANADIKTWAGSAERRFSTFATGVQRSFAGINRIVGIFGVGFGAVQIKRFVEGSLQAVGGLGELATQLGISTDALQSYQFAALQSGLSSEQLNQALARLTRTAGEASEGNKSAIQSFDQLGIKILDANGKVRPTEDLMRDVADAISRIEDPARRGAAAASLFGDRVGQKLLPMLENGARGLDDFSEAARRSGFVIDEHLIKKADEISDKWEAQKEVMARWAQSLLVEVLPDVISFVQQVDAAFMDSAAAVREWQMGLRQGFGQAQAGRLTEKIALVEGQLEAARAAGQERRVQALENQLRGLREAVNRITGEGGIIGLGTLTEATLQPSEIFREIAPAGSGSPIATGDETRALREQLQVRLDLLEAMDREDEDRRARQNDLAALIVAEDEATASLRQHIAALDQDIREKAEEGITRLRERVEELASAVGRDLGGAFADAITGISSFEQAAVQAFRSMTSALLEFAFSAEGLGWGGKLVQALFGSIGGAAFGDFRDWNPGNVKMMAGGGFLGPGEWAVAGEHGPEPIFGGRTGMTVIPHGEGGGGRSVYIEKISVGEGVSPGQMRMAMAELRAQVPDISIGAIVKDRRGMGPTRKTFRG